jgi:hypothetical protein
MFLNSKIVAYLIVNNISFEVSDYQTGQPEGEEDQVLYWNTEKLGPYPSQSDLNSALETHQSNIAATKQAKEDAKASAIAKLTALGLTTDELSHLIAN